MWRRRRRRRRRRRHKGFLCRNCRQCQSKVISSQLSVQDKSITCGTSGRTCISIWCALCIVDDVKVRRGSPHPLRRYARRLTPPSASPDRRVQLGEGSQYRDKASPLNSITDMDLFRVNICQNIWSLLGGVGVNPFEGVGLLSRLVDG